MKIQVVSLFDRIRAPRAKRCRLDVGFPMTHGTALRHRSDRRSSGSHRYAMGALDVWPDAEYLRVGGPRLSASTVFLTLVNFLDCRQAYFCIKRHLVTHP